MKIGNYKAHVSLALITLLAGCGLGKKSQDGKKQDGEAAVEETAGVQEDLSVDQPTDEFGLLLFDESINNTAGWEAENSVYIPDNNQSEQVSDEARSIVSDCLKLPQSDVGTDQGFSASAASQVCASDAKILNLAWKIGSETHDQ